MAIALSELALNYKGSVVIPDPSVAWKEDLTHPHDYSNLPSEASLEALKKELGVNIIYNGPYMPPEEFLPKKPTERKLTLINGSAEKYPAPEITNPTGKLTDVSNISKSQDVFVAGPREPIDTGKYYSNGDLF